MEKVLPSLPILSTRPSKSRQISVTGNENLPGLRDPHGNNHVLVFLIYRGFNHIYQRDPSPAPINITWLFITVKNDIPRGKFELCGHQCPEKPLSAERMELPIVDLGYDGETGAKVIGEGRQDFITRK